MNDRRASLVKLANMLYRCTQAYTNEVLKKYRLGSGNYPFLMILFKNEGINQNQISRELNVDKAMSARVIKNLIELGYLMKEEDPEDSRAFKLYLTEAAKAIIPDIKKELRIWNETITKDLSENEKDKIIDLLSMVLKNAKNCRNK